MVDAEGIHETSEFSVDPIPRRIVITNHQYTAFCALDSAAPDSLGVPPHDLREVAAHFSRGAMQRLDVEVVFLVGPHHHRVSGAKVVIPRPPPEQVLAERTVGVVPLLAFAEGAGLQGPHVGEQGQLLVPRQHRLVVLGADLVVGPEEVVGRHLRRGVVGLLACGGIIEDEQRGGEDYSDGCSTRRRH